MQSVPDTPPFSTTLRCVKCGYDLGASALPGPQGDGRSPGGGRCPECGTLAVPRCAECGYDLSGIGTLTASIPAGGPARCPECGASFDFSTVRVLPNLPGFWRLAWVCLRPAGAYLALVVVVGMLIARRPFALWGGALACFGPPLLLGVTLCTVVGFTSAHYVEKERWWVVFLMVLLSLSVSSLVAIACSLGLGTV